MTTDVGVISASVSAGATVTAAYLYTATQDTSTSSIFFNTPPTGVELNGTEVTYDATFANTGNEAARPEIQLSSHRADVTSIVAAVIDGGAGGVFDFDYAETGNNFNIDGSALVVVYEDPALDETTISILNGFSDSTGDTDAKVLDEGSVCRERLKPVAAECCGTKRANDGI